VIAAINAARLKLWLGFLALCALTAEHAIRFVHAMLELAHQLLNPRKRQKQQPDTPRGVHNPLDTTAESRYNQSTRSTARPRRPQPVGPIEFAECGKFRYILRAARRPNQAAK
jgi:hypothetical protein